MSFWVIADISNYTYKTQRNYHYFELVEKDSASSRVVARIAGRAWGNASLHIRNFEKTTGQQFKNDINVLVQVSVQYNPSFGLQLNLLDIDTSFTLGKFEQQRKETLERLVRENGDFIQQNGEQYFTRNKGLKFNRVLQRIAVLSSDTSAGFQDFKHTLEHNPFGYHFDVDDYFTLVQGEGNARQFISRLIAVFESEKQYDALVIIRGGGAQSDFVMFDNYELNRAIAKFPVPIITGIGHQKNETIADLMAHTSTKTPTKAAELLIAHNRRFEEQLLSMQQTVLIRTFQMINLQKDRLGQLNQLTINTSKNLLHEHHRLLMNRSNMLISNPRVLMANKQKDLGNLLINMKTYSRMYFQNKQANIAHFESLVKMMSPQNILNKGFALLMQDGRITSDASAIEPGTELTVHLASAILKTTVKSKSTNNGNQFNL